jgi:hypothetical protein
LESKQYINFTRIPSSSSVLHQPAYRNLHTCLFVDYYQSPYSSLITPTPLPPKKMLVSQALLGLGALLSLSFGTEGFTTSCTYQRYKCGYTMVTDFGIFILSSLSSLTRPIPIWNLLTYLYKGYNGTELDTAVNKTHSVPLLDSVQRLQVLYRCVDVNGGLLANAFCIAGCISITGLYNDECAM